MLIAELAPKLSWYIARSSGMVSWLLLTASVIWGLVLSARILNRATAPGWLLDLHRFLGASSIVLTAIHILGLVGDNWMHIGWSETFVPMASKYRPGPVAWGVVAFYMLLAVELTSLVKSHIPRKLWRVTHYLSFPLFVATTVHGLFSGTDTEWKPYEWATVAGVSIVMVMLIVRIIATRDKKARQVAAVQRA
jgi:predicted ferric reductase